MCARDTLARMREDAQHRLDELEERLATLQHARQGESDDDEHDPEGVTLSSEWSHLQGIARAARQELDHIDEALERVAAGTYGVCRDCGEAIPAGRLEARPFATRCVPCAERHGL